MKNVVKSLLIFSTLLGAALLTGPVHAATVIPKTTPKVVPPPPVVPPRVAPSPC